MSRAPDTRNIEDYALIGNCRSAALVGRDGAIDWLCWPRFDSPSLFAALLDPVAGGAWTMAPVGAAAERSRRQYLGDTAVLCTTFNGGEDEVTLTDAMILTSEEDAKKILSPESELVRVVTCTRGRVEMSVCFDPRPGYGAHPARLVDRGKLGIRLSTPGGLFTLRADVPMQLQDGRQAVGRFVLCAGQSAHFSLTHTVDAPAVIPPLGDWTRRALCRTSDIWQAWADETTYAGPYRTQVVRSALVVRMLAYPPSGAIVAAPTTSLPETIGGAFNWDYRFCWLRDAAFTVRGMLALGHRPMAEAFTTWLLHATRLSQPKLMVLYDVYGRPPPTERVLPHLAGYARSSPVRTGNGADTQVQLDCYGEVIDAVWRVACAGMSLDREMCSTIEAFGRTVCRHWTEPDAGIWETRGQPQRHTHSAAMCWVALDKLIDLQERGMMRRRHQALFEEHRARIRNEVDRRGFNERLGSFTAVFDGDTLDASALLLGWYGYEKPHASRMVRTCRALVHALSPAPGLLYRNRHAGADEGAFGICSFWVAEQLANGGGSAEEALDWFERVLAYANDVGLFSEEIDPTNGRALGNFPQVFTHVGLINAALALEERKRRDRDGAGGSAT